LESRALCAPLASATPHDSQQHPPLGRPTSPGYLAKALSQLASVHSVLVNTGKAWALYVVLRVVFFAVPFAVLMLMNWPWWLALIIATLVALALSVIFLSKPRGEASTSIYEWRNRDRTSDDIAEDELTDKAEAKDSDR